MRFWDVWPAAPYTVIITITPVIDTRPAALI